MKEKFLIYKKYEISSAHKLDINRAHPCSHLHGHNYEITIYITGKINEKCLKTS